MIISKCFFKDELLLVKLLITSIQFFLAGLLRKKSEKLHFQVTFRFPYVSHLRSFNESYKDTEAITVSHAECSRARYFSLCEIA